MQEKLNRRVYIYCGEITNRSPFQKIFYNASDKSKPKRKKTYWDYPAAASVCCLAAGRNIYEGFSQRAYDNSYPNSILRTQLTKLGKIGEKAMKKVGTKNYLLGQCAEPHAARELLKKENSCKNLSDIHFSVTMRPRTRKILQPCDNCKKVFPTLK